MTSNGFTLKAKLQEFGDALSHEAPAMEFCRICLLAGRKLYALSYGCILSACTIRTSQDILQYSCVKSHTPHVHTSSIQTYIHTCIHTYMCIYIYMYVCNMHRMHAHIDTRGTALGWHYIKFIHTVHTLQTNKQTYIHTCILPRLTLRYISLHTLHTRHAFIH